MTKEALPGVLRNRGKGVFISGEQGNNGQILGNRGAKKTILGNREHKKNKSIFGEQGNKPIYFRETREQVPPWEGLTKAKIILPLPPSELSGSAPALDMAGVNFQLYNVP